MLFAIGKNKKMLFIYTNTLYYLIFFFYLNTSVFVGHRYMKPLSNGNAAEDESLGCKMLFLSKQVNALQQHVEEHHLDRRSVCWEPVDDLIGMYK